MEGEEAQFTCAPKWNTSTVVWMKDDIPLAEFKELRERSILTEVGTLIIYPTSMTDMGEYKCEVTNLEGDKQRASAFLNVECKLRILHFKFC